MAKTTNDSNGNGGMVGQASRFIREVGLPTALLFALGWVSVNYWIKPQTRLIEAMTVANQMMAKTYESLNAGMASNHDQLVDILEETKQTTKAMASAYMLMEDVPAQREEELELARESTTVLKAFTASVKESHDQQINTHNQILDKLDR